MADPANPPMVSEVTICNQALTWLGQDTITSLNDQNEQANWMLHNYYHLRDAVLEARMWTFATHRERLNYARELGDGHYYEFDIEEKWLGIYRCYREGSDRMNPIMIQEWRMENGKLLAPEEYVWVWGLVRVTDTGKFTSLFTQALAARLAADAAVPLTGNRQLQIDMWSLYNDKLEQAAVRDGQQGGNDYITQTRLTGVRARGGIFGGYY